MDRHIDRMNDEAMTDANKAAQMPERIYITRESDQPNDIKVWGMEVHNSTEYIRASSVPSDKERAALIDELLELQRHVINGTIRRGMYQSGGEAWARVGKDLKRWSDRRKEIKQALAPRHFGVEGLYL